MHPVGQEVSLQLQPFLCEVIILADSILSLCLHAVSPGSVHSMSFNLTGCPVREWKPSSHHYGIIGKLSLQLLLQ